MADYKIMGDVSDVYNIKVECDGHSYCVIFGRYENGGFCCIPDWGIGCELSFFKDKFWNTEQLGKVLKRKRAVNAIVDAIAQF